MFLASMCDLVGQAGAVDRRPRSARFRIPEHDRITYLPGDAGTDAGRRTGKGDRRVAARSLVILGGASGTQVIEAFRNYASLVPVGSYLVVEDTILEGNPVWPEFGSGPAVAVQQIVDAGDFAADPFFERFGRHLQRRRLPEARTLSRCLVRDGR